MVPSRARVARKAASAFTTPGFLAYVRVLAEVPDWRSASSQRCRISSSTSWIPSGSILAIVASLGLRKIDDLDPVRVLPHRGFLQLGELAAGRVDRVARQAVRELAHRQQVAARRVDVETARLLLGRHTSDRRQRALRPIDPEAGQRARRALRGVEELAVGRDVQVGGRRLALEVGRQRADGLLRREISRGGVVVEDVEQAVVLADDVGELAARSIDEVAQTGLRLHFSSRRCGWCLLAGRRAESEMVDAIESLPG